MYLCGEFPDHSNLALVYNLEPKEKLSFYKLKSTNLDTIYISFP